jgi:D-galactose 1-dehydrogenase
MSRIRIAIVGLGKIARDQHIPALAAGADFELVGIASPHHALEGVPSFTNLESLLREIPDVAAVALCTPPVPRFRIACEALHRGLHVLLEKPPGVTVSQVAALTELARQKNAALFAAWHSRHAAGVQPARDWLAQRRILGVRVTWKEDVLVWHPGQTWIWQAGGLGVFDPGINALSILTRIVPGGMMLHSAEMSFPKNCECPIAASLTFADAHGAPVHAEFDFRQTGPETWDIEVDTDAGRLVLSLGGSILRIDGKVIPTAELPEYHHVYARFAELVRERRIDADVAPLQLTADAFLCARRHAVDAFPHEAG